MSEEIKNNDVVEENVEESKTEEKVNDTISLTLSNGESYVIANSSFDWGSMISNLNNLYGNLQRINMILSDLVGVTQQKSIETIADNAIEELTEFGKGVGVDLSHKNPTLTKRETAILMCFDAASIVQMIIRYAEVYNAQIVMNQKHAESNQHVISLLNSLLMEKEEMRKKKDEELTESFEPGDEDLSEMTAKEYIDKKYSNKNKESVNNELVDLIDDPDIIPVSESEYAPTVMSIDDVFKGGRE